MINSPQNSEIRDKLRVLVVDDNFDAANMLEVLLTMEGHEVRTANDGREALDAAAEYRPGVVLLDIGLPEMDGYEVAKRLRAEMPEISLIALSGWGEEEDRNRSNEVGFNYHFVKPVDIDELKKTIAKTANLK